MDLTTPVVPEFSLRDTKASRLRLALLDAFLRRIEKEDFDRISVKELCAECSISEPTFFNHFASKHDLLAFYVALWSVEAQMVLGDPRASAWKNLSGLFDLTGRAVAKSPSLMREIVAYQARNGGMAPIGSSPPTAAELSLRFGRDGARAVPQPAGIDTILAALLNRAVTRKELPDSIGIDAAVVSLCAVFFGVPMSQNQSSKVTDYYRMSLETVWKGLGGKI